MSQSHPGRQAQFMTRSARWKNTNYDPCSIRVLRTYIVILIYYQVCAGHCVRKSFCEISFQDFAVGGHWKSLKSTLWTVRFSTAPCCFNIEVQHAIVMPEISRQNNYLSTRYNSFKYYKTFFFCHADEWGK